MKALKTFGTLALTALITASCSNPKGWSISGTVSGMEESDKLVIEANNGNAWYLLDSIATAADGTFAYASETSASHGEIMRLTLAGKGSIYFPIDSVDAITVSADAASFGTAHKLSGTGVAERFSVIDSLVANTDDLNELQTKLAGFITTDTTGTVAYYAVCKSKNSRLVFDPYDTRGNRIYGAAAQVFATYRPLDARGAALKQTYFNGRIAMGKVQPSDTVIEVPEAGLINIERYDNKGESHSLATLAEKKGVVVLSFTDYSESNSPAYNALLFDLYTKYQNRGLEIYQLSFDANEVSWKEAADNLPWITVWNAPTDGTNIVLQYNISVLPLTYIIDRSGEIAERIINPADIEKAIKKYI